MRLRDIFKRLFRFRPREEPTPSFDTSFAKELPEGDDGMSEFSRGRDDEFGQHVAIRRERMAIDSILENENLTADSRG